MRLITNILLIIETTTTEESINLLTNNINVLTTALVAEPVETGQKFLLLI